MPTAPLSHGNGSSRLASKIMTRDDGWVNTVRWRAVFKPRPSREATRHTAGGYALWGERYLGWPQRLVGGDILAA
jgi:hypothetical protein